MTDRTSHRSILERWVIIGKLVLEMPAHFGNGDADPLVDMPLLFDEEDERPLLPGTSIAGALRSYMREREYGFGKAEDSGSKTSLLFGSVRVTEDEGNQSPLIINDARGSSAGVELRDGVAIESETRTAADNKKFDIQLLAAGSEFDLRFELIVGNKDVGSQVLRDALYTALHGLEKGDITLGARKRRGFGQVTVKNWEVYKFDLQTKEGLINWLGFDQELKTPVAQPGDNLAKKLGASLIKEDNRSSAHLVAHFAIDGTLLIRSGFGETASSPDSVHLRSKRGGSSVPIIPGTSLAGVLRQRALKIARTLAPGNDKDIAITFVDSMFGPSEIKANEKHAKASRVSVKETKIENTTQLVMTRVKIDRFTGGAYESALFSEQPEIGKPNAKSVTLDLTLRNPTSAELGLLLLLLKDLWTGDLPIGGESSVGRGRLKGIKATLDAPATPEISQKTSWTFTADGNNLRVEEVKGTATEKLEDWVNAFNKEVMKEQVNHA